MQIGPNLNWTKFLNILECLQNYNIFKPKKLFSKVLEVYQQTQNQNQRFLFKSTTGQQWVFSFLFLKTYQGI
jgi:hypothetical protein